MSVAPALVSTYQKNTDVDTKRAAAQALFLANDAPDLVTLARGEKDLEMKKYLVQQLSLMHNQEATKYMLEILNKYRGIPMRRDLFIAATLSVSMLAMAQQQPKVINAQFHTESAGAGLSATVNTLQHSNGPLWLGYEVAAVPG
jgi:hypothetical protein